MGQCDPESATRPVDLDWVGYSVPRLISDRASRNNGPKDARGCRVEPRQFPDDLARLRPYDREPMGHLRTWLHGHRALAALVLALVLSVKLLVPTGFMIADDAKVLTVVICSGAADGPQTTQIVIPQTGKSAGHAADKVDPCPYSALSMASDIGADAPLLAAALAFILALGFAPVSAVRRLCAPYLRPPLRGPPLAA